MFGQQKIKNRQNIDKEKSKILFPLPQPPFRNQEKKSTKFFAQSPPTRLSFPHPSHAHTHTHTHTHRLISHIPPATPRNSSYAAAQGIRNLL